MKGSVRLLQLLETKAKAEVRKSLYRVWASFWYYSIYKVCYKTTWLIHQQENTACWKISSERSVLSIPFHFPTEPVPSGVISKLIAKLQGCSWKCFTFNLKSFLFIHHCGWCFQLVLDDESHVRFKGMLFVNGYLESILLCLELLRMVNKIGIQAHRNEMHF